MRHLLLGLAVLCGTLAGVAGAQTAELLPAPTQACLQHVDGVNQAPDYPAAAYNAARPGRVQVNLTFTAPNRAPEPSFMLQEGGEAFVEAVRAHAKGLRVPCMAVGAEPVQLRKDFVFSPGTERASSLEAEDPRAQARKAMLRCVVHAQGWTRPGYPHSARIRGLQGRVLVRATYANATDPPQVEVFSRPYAERLADEIRDWTRETRLPCHTGEPLTMDVTYTYVFEGDQYGFKTLDFRQFLGNVKGIREQTLKLDTGTMGCPFDVQLAYHQPQLPNKLHVMGERKAQQQPLLAWMAASELSLSRNALDAVWGDTVRITIPCVNIDLKPKEKTS